MDMIAKYDNAAPEWQQKIHRLGYRQAYSQFLAERTIPSGCVLDAGTGTGAFAQAWIIAGGSMNLTLLDPSGNMLAKAQTNLAALKVKAKTARNQLEAFTPCSPFRAILAAHVIEHCEDPRAALLRFADWLQPGGLLFLVVSKPHWCNWLIWIRYRHRWFSEKQIQQMADAAGLKHRLTHHFTSGPPSFTSLSYIFSKP
jgi:ubiquinone/menaquinone biosynthesis C-methylase UbiE